MGQEWTVFQFVALSGFVMGCPRNIVNGQGLKVSTAKHNGEHVMKDSWLVVCFLLLRAL